MIYRGIEVGVGESEWLGVQVNDNKWNIAQGQYNVFNLRHASIVCCQHILPAGLLHSLASVLCSSSPAPSLVYNIFCLKLKQKKIVTSVLFVLKWPVGEQYKLAPWTLGWSVLIEGPDCVLKAPFVPLVFVDLLIRIMTFISSHPFSAFFKGNLKVNYDLSNAID